MGAGVISAQYLTNLVTLPDVDVRFVADRNPDRAAATAAGFGVPRHGGLPEMLLDPTVELVVSLTPPAAHVAIAIASLEAGKHVWTEKPLATTVSDARALVGFAEERGLRIAAAPDSVLGGTVQTAFRAMSSGAIGTPVSAVAEFRSPGPDLWHPNPAFLFARGAGPLFDIGPYFVSALTLVLGSAVRVTAISSMARAERTVMTGPRAGEVFRTGTATHVSAFIEFESGAVAETAFSFQDHKPAPARFDVVGTDGTLAMPSPLTYGSPSRVYSDDPEGVELPLIGTTTTRGIGVVDLARSIRSGLEPYCSGDAALHTLEVLEAIDRSTRTRLPQDLVTAVARRDPKPSTWSPDAATLL